MALHVSRSVRAELGLEPHPPPGAGKVELADLAAAGELSRRLAAAGGAGPPISAGELYALSGLESILMRVVLDYAHERGPSALEDFLHRGQRALGVEETERLLTLFSRDFGLAGGRESLLREFLVWWAIEENPAAVAAGERLHPGFFRSDSGLDSLRRALESGGKRGGAEDELLSRLRAPARAAPESLASQVRWVIEEWGELVGAERVALLRGLDLLAEEAKRETAGPPGPPSAGPIEAPSFAGLDDESENYAPDRSWMPAVVLLAKNVNVWLDQLAKRYDRRIAGLDEVPDAALDEIADWGFTALWLIGVWERSAASQRLKRLCGNPEAVASAYSLRGYRVAPELGGDEALADLQRRALERGIRLGSDMVPNHLGLDSDWLFEHPERFLSVAECPFPAYTFDGPDLSPDPAVGVWVEDHYFDRSDAAVVFKREDRATGEVRFVYHGNDGTAMPWNDTAQLDYLSPETRDAVIETILEVARRFPLIRFDAAMTLARRHYHRLWFPAPGSGGAIPSRAEHGLEPEAFAERMPEEFWREVVERVGREAPDTLLLAEAFWLMEGYFVRSLGMHRVYNSAFMNMLRERENSDYRRLIKETLLFDPRILQRYVNFLTNPDERTAIDQFGADDRYFGACLLLATLPGMPMFGHGQIEGLKEKYGMEYRRAYSDEDADSELVGRHEREIVPLLRRRRVFAGVDRFELYDFVDSTGAVNENVLAYSNGPAEEPVVVLFNNDPAAAIGCLRGAAARASRPERPFAAAIGLSGDAGTFWIFRDALSGQSYLRPAAEIATNGLAVELGPFGYRVLEGFELVHEDAEGRWGRLWARRGLAGVDDLRRELEDLDLEPAIQALAAAFGRPVLASLDDKGDVRSGLRDGLVEAVAAVLRGLDGDSAPGEARLRADLEARLEAAVGLATLERSVVHPATRRSQGQRRELGSWLAARPEARAGLAALQILDRIEAAAEPPAERLRRLPIEKILGPVLDGLGGEPERVGRVVAAVRIGWERGWGSTSELPGAAQVRAMASRWIGDPAIRRWLGRSASGDTASIERRNLDELIRWRQAAALSAATVSGGDLGAHAELVSGWLEAGERLGELVWSAAGYGFGAPGPGEPALPASNTVSE